MKLTLNQAAKTIGKSKGTISKALNSGDMSAEKADDGAWQIDHSELMRWVSSTRSREQVKNHLEPPGNTPETPGETVGERGAQMALMRERLDDATATIEDLRERLDASETERRALSQQLLAPPPQPRDSAQDPHSGAETPQKRRRGIFGWFRR